MTRQKRIQPLNHPAYYLVLFLIIKRALRYRFPKLVSHFKKRDTVLLNVYYKLHSFSLFPYFFPTFLSLNNLSYIASERPSLDDGIILREGIMKIELNKVNKRGGGAKTRSSRSSGFSHRFLQSKPLVLAALPCNSSMCTHIRHPRSHTLAFVKGKE